MIQDIISNIKLTTSKIIEDEVELLATATTLENLLNEIDFTSEVVPVEDFERLKKLFTSLKKEKLNSKEIKLLHEISKSVDSNIIKNS